MHVLPHGASVTGHSISGSRSRVMGSIRRSSVFVVVGDIDVLGTEFAAKKESCHFVLLLHNHDMRH
jgi:hypothetical protein